MNVLTRFLIAICLCAGVFGGVASARYHLLVSSGKVMTESATAFLSQLNETQKKQATRGYEDPARVDWHFIPKPTRKGLQIREMNAEQRTAAHALLKSCLSEIGYGKVVKIIALEELLKALEVNKVNGAIRDNERYYFTLFGTPTREGKWGLSVEGHHLSLNFVVEKEQVVCFSPWALCTNPAVVMSDAIPSIPRGQRVLAAEEELAFELLASLTPEQKKVAIIAEKAPAEVRAPGEAQPPHDAAVGIELAKLTSAQQLVLRKLVGVYLGNLPEDVAAQRAHALESEDWKQVTFAWAGAEKTGVGHYYRIQGKSFVIELVNTQPDAAGNPANHVHCVWRSLTGDFALEPK